MFFLADSNFTLPSDADNYMLVSVLFKAAEASGGYLEIAEVELGRFPAVSYQDISDYRRPTAVLLFVFFALDARPFSAALVAMNPVFVLCDRFRF